MPATKKAPAAKKAAPAKKTTKPAKKLYGPPLFSDPLVLEAVKKFEKTAQALAKDAGKTLRAFYAGELEGVPSGYSGHHDFSRTVYPLLSLSRLAEHHWAVLGAMQAHATEPTKRNENTLRRRITELLDHVDRVEREPLWNAIQAQTNERDRKKAWAAHSALESEHRRKRLGLTPGDFAKLLKKERSEYREQEAKRKAKFAQFEAERAAAETANKKAKKAGKALV